MLSAVARSFAGSLLSAAALTLSFAPVAVGADAAALPDPDGKPADMSKPAQVYILLGQSNMLGFGKIEPGKGEPDGSLRHAVTEKKLYPYLVDEAGNWTERKDVRNVRVMGSGLGGMRQFNNEWLTIKGRTIGPEVGIGHHLGEAIEAPVLILKSCIGNRALGWDLLPPGSKGYNFDNFTYAGYHQSPMKWPEGTKPVPMGWAAGIQYDGDIYRANHVLGNLSTFYPGQTCYEVAGFFWWQGDKDSRDMGLASHYEENLVALIKALRVQYDSPKAKVTTSYKQPFLLAT